MIKINQNQPRVSSIDKFLILDSTGKKKYIRIYTARYRMLDGSRKILVQRVNDGSIITRFDKTPIPRKLTDVVCPHFLELKWAYGCPFDCSWCYLKGTFRFHNGRILPGFKVKDLNKVILHTEAFLKKVQTPEILNTGEIADSLMLESKKISFSKIIIPLFEKQKKHKVLFVTKSNRIENLLQIYPHKQAIISFTLNALPISQKWEKRAPNVLERIEAATRLLKAGYEIRIRIDPMVPVEKWNEYYLDLVNRIFNKFRPERITLGSLRGLQSTINGTKDKSWVKYLKEYSNWGKKIDFNTRYKMYKFIMDYMRKRWRYNKVSLCKETVAMWKALGRDYKKIKCNCIW